MRSTLFNVPSFLRKRLFLLLFAGLCSHLLFSQKLMHSAGATASLLYGRNKETNSLFNFKMPYSTFTYFPRYNFVEFENASLSFGTPVGVGLNILTDAYSSKWGVGLVYDLSAVFDVNIGCKSAYDNPNSFGGYVGTGFSYTHIGGSKSGYIDFSGPTYGPLVRGGFRFLFSRGRMADHALNIGLYYKKGIEFNKLSTAGLNVLWDF